MLGAATFSDQAAPNKEVKVLTRGSNLLEELRMPADYTKATDEQERDSCVNE